MCVIATALISFVLFFVVDWHIRFVKKFVVLLPHCLVFAAAAAAAEVGVFEVEQGSFPS